MVQTWAFAYFVENPCDVAPHGEITAMQFRFVYSVFNDALILNRLLQLMCCS